MLCWALDSALLRVWPCDCVANSIHTERCYYNHSYLVAPEYYTSNHISPCIHARALQICATELGEAEPHARDRDWVADAAVHVLSVKIAATAL